MADVKEIADLIGKEIAGTGQLNKREQEKLVAAIRRLALDAFAINRIVKYSGGSGGGGYTELNRIRRYPYNGGDVVLYPINRAGLLQAFSEAGTSDTITLPPATLPGDFIIPANIMVLGAGSKSTIFSGQVTGASGAYLRDCAITRTDNSSSNLIGLVTPASGTFAVNTVAITITQSGSGAAYALSASGGGDIKVRGCYLFASSGSGSGYAVLRSSGNVYLEEGCELSGTTAKTSGSNIYDLSFDPEIHLHDRAGAFKGAFSFTAAGLTAALAAATSGDVVSLPPGTVSGNNTVPAGVALSGIDREKTILSGQITLAGANSVLANLSVTRTANDANALIAVICAADVSPLIFNCDITAIQSGSGDAKALQVLEGTGQPRIEYSYIDGQSTGGSGYGIYQEATAAGPSTLTWIEADPNTSQGASVGIVTNGAVTGWEWVVYKLSGYNPSPAVGQLQINITNNLNSHTIKLMRTDIDIGGTDYNTITGNHYPEKLTLDTSGATFSAAETKNIVGTSARTFSDPGYFILMYGFNNGNTANIQINSIKWIENLSPYSTIDLWDPSSDTSAISTLRWCRINGSTTDILAGAGGTVKVYACDFDPASISGTIEQLWGDRGAWDTTNYGPRHADDWAAGDTHHPVVTLAADADTLLGLTGQQLSLDSQNENTVLAGPASAPAADPTFRALVAADIPSVPGKDTTAIHDNESGEINAVTEKATPINADLVIIEDSAASYAKKKAQLGNLPSASTDLIARKLVWMGW